MRGTVVFHQELRDWLGLRLEKPACGQTEIELVFSDARAWRSAKSLRGCAVSATGVLFDSPSGYYSAEIAVSDAVLQPESSCHPFPIEPDPAAAPIPPNLDTFRASITVDYRGKGKVEVQIRRGGMDDPLDPWQAFVHYHLTGGQDVMWFGCRKGFHISAIIQSPKSPDGFIQDDEEFPGTVLNMEKVNRVEFACEKIREKPSPDGKAPPAKPK